MDNVKYRTDKLFGYEVPITCPDVPEDVLFPENSWGSKDEYWKKYDALAARFGENFKLFEKGCSQDVIDAGTKAAFTDKIKAHPYPSQREGFLKFGRGIYSSTFVIKL